VIVGSRAKLDDRLATHLDRAPLTSRVVFVDRVTDHQLASLYRGADCLVHPSLYEGFGLPLLEGMACGTPVVAGACTSMPEVLGDAGALVDPRDAGALERVLVDLLSSPGKREQFSARGVNRARHFTWKHSARLTVEAYMKAHRADERN
jgi:glycosyltransferase involved in cell wall biosynthesis